MTGCTVYVSCTMVYVSCTKVFAKWQELSKSKGGIVMDFTNAVIYIQYNKTEIDILITIHPE